MQRQQWSLFEHNELDECADGIERVGRVGMDAGKWAMLSCKGFNVVTDVASRW